MGRKSLQLILRCLLEVKQADKRVQGKEGQLHRKITLGIQQPLMARRTVQAKLLTLLMKTQVTQVSGQSFVGYLRLCH